MRYENEIETRRPEFATHRNPAWLGQAGYDSESKAPASDVSGYIVFSQGDTGAAHVMAHKLLDAGRMADGRKQLGQWLDGRTGSGSDWLHLQFHMGVFELATGDWDSAYARFLGQILPAASTTLDALTDAPAMLLRLALSATAPVPLPWQALRRTALASLQQSNEPFVEIHNLLALAGSGDAAGIEDWSRVRAFRRASPRERLVARMSQALHAYASGAYEQAAKLLHVLVPRISLVGGSRAQNELFEQLEDRCWRLAMTNGVVNLTRSNCILS